MFAVFAELYVVHFATPVVRKKDTTLRIVQIIISIANNIYMFGKNKTYSSISFSYSTSLKECGHSNQGAVLQWQTLVKSFPVTIFSFKNLFLKGLLLFNTPEPRFLRQY